MRVTGIPLVVTYHPSLNSLSAITNKILILSYMDKYAKRAFTLSTTVPFLSTDKLNSYTVRVKTIISREMEISCRL